MLCRNAEGIVLLNNKSLSLHRGFWWWDVGCPIISEEDAKQLPLQEAIMVSVEERVREAFNETIKLPSSPDLNLSLYGDLGLDSLDVVDLVLNLEAEFADENVKIDDDAVSSWKTYGDVVHYVTERVK